MKRKKSSDFNILLAELLCSESAKYASQRSYSSYKFENIPIFSALHLCNYFLFSCEVPQSGCDFSTNMFHGLRRVSKSGSRVSNL